MGDQEALGIASLSVFRPKGITMAPKGPACRCRVLFVDSKLQLPNESTGLPGYGGQEYDPHAHACRHNECLECRHAGVHGADGRPSSCMSITRTAQPVTPWEEEVRTVHTVSREKH